MVRREPGERSADVVIAASVDAEELERDTIEIVAVDIEHALSVGRGWGINDVRVRVAEPGLAGRRALSLHDALDPDELVLGPIADERGAALEVHRPSERVLQVRTRPLAAR